MYSTFLAVFTGCAPWRTQIDKAVQDRFNKIRPTLKPRSGEHLYGGNRCKGENLAWRMLQNVTVPGVRPSGIASFHPRYKRPYMRPVYWLGEKLLPLRIKLGLCDQYITEAWHSAASAEHWYTYEKEW